MQHVRSREISPAGRPAQHQIVPTGAPRAVQATLSSHYLGLPLPPAPIAMRRHEVQSLVEAPPTSTGASSEDAIELRSKNCESLSQRSGDFGRIWQYPCPIGQNTGRLRNSPDSRGENRIVDSRHAAAAERLVEDLNRLRLEVGNPSLGRLAQLSGGQLSKSTLDDHLSRRRVRLPSWHLVAAYVTACHHAAASTGLDVERLGTLNDWHRRYTAALEGDVSAQCPIKREAANKHGARVGQDPEAPAELTTRLVPPAGPSLVRGQRSHNLNQPALTESAKALKNLPVLDKPAVHNSDDELEISAQGAGKWLVHWLPAKPSTTEPGIGCVRV